MTMARFRILAAGPHVSIQDAGRFGLRRFGVTASGPMDRFSYRAANQALGNPIGATAIEVSLGGLKLECLEGAASLSIAGGGFVVETARRMDGWQVFSVSAGDCLTIRPGHWGSWCYLAFAGQLDVPVWLGSQSTHGGSGQGGGKLVPGAILTLQNAQLREDLHGPCPCPVFARPRHFLRVVKGPQDRFFPTQTYDELLNSAFFLTTAYDRMGVRLNGPSLCPSALLSMPSEPIPRGAIQIAGDGVATILLADHQTTGGYPKIACILDCDLDAFVQLRGRDQVSFAEVSPTRAIEIARLHHRQVNAYLSRRGG